MQFQITTDYAIRILTFLYQNEGESFTASEISKQLGISYQYFMKIINKLIKADMVVSVRGRKGGYTLVKDVGEASLYDIIKMMEGEIRLNRCLEEDGFCSRNFTSHCAVHKIFQSLQDEFIGSLEDIKISSIQ